MNILITQHQGISGQDNIVLSNVLKILLPQRTMQNQYLELWYKTFSLTFPVTHQTGRCYYQSRQILLIWLMLLFQIQQPGQRLYRFTQPHIISQNTIKLVFI